MFKLKYLVISLEIIALLIGALLTPSKIAAPALAHTLPDDPGSYDPNTLISNDNFIAYGQDGTGVNNFLAQKGSWLTGYNIPEYQEVPYKFRNGDGNCEWRTVSTRQFNDVTGEALYGLNAGDLMAREGHDHGINPQVTLVTLEKESSAITQHSKPTSSLPSSPIEMWVLGYGWNDTMAACAYDYDTARARAINFGGVGQQIAYATAFFRSKYTNPGSCGTPSGTAPTNNATKALYCYTPYTHDGNHNFWHFFTQWFQTAPSFEPTAYGTDEEGKPSIVYNNQRWPLVDVDTFNQYLPGRSLSPLSADMLALPRRHTIGRLIKKGGDGRMFYLLNGKRRHVNSDRVLRLYGWRPEDVVGNVDDLLIDAIPVGDPMLGIIRMENTSTTYLQTRGENHRIADQAIFKDNWNFDWSEVIEVPPYVINTIPTSNNLGMIALSNEGTAYLIDNGKRYHIPDNNTAERWGLNWNTAVRFDTPLLWRFPEDNRVTPYARNEKTGHVYILEHGQRRWLSEKRISELGINSRDIVNHSDAYLNRIPEGAHY